MVLSLPLFVCAGATQSGPLRCVSSHRWLSTIGEGEVMTPEQRRQFVLDHRTAIFGYGRANDGPAMSIVFYAADENEIVVSTMAERAKAKAVRRHGKVSL